MLSVVMSSFADMAGSLVTPPLAIGARGLLCDLLLVGGALFGRVFFRSVDAWESESKNWESEGKNEALANLNDAS